ncbi:MAG: sulfatase [Firmicutes bacterium]|nr:sulfatase [Bacillota bacterium]MCM1401051.1 sulfatase [Bacteroides sp.]MCM1476970.1 sulfatase [Bacteroides sp.]
MKSNLTGLFVPITAMVAGSAAAKAPVANTDNSADKKPLNIVYIMTDDHTAQAMSCYDKRYTVTPNLDRIAENGVRFTNSFVANSLSGPSRACMLTGKHSHKNGFTDNTTCVFDASQPTFPRYLQDAGYETALIGKWHLESLPEGFNHWEILPGQGDYYNPRFIEMSGDTIVRPGYLTHIITDRSIDWLENGRDKSKPFCLLIHHKAIHRNWMADTADLELFEDKTFPIPENFFDDYARRQAAAEQEMSIASNHDMDPIYDLKMYRPDKESRLKSTYEDFVGRMNPEQKAKWDAFYEPITEKFYNDSLQGKELAEWKFQRYIRDYLKVVKSLDDNVGRTLKYLEDNDLLKNTLVVYTSDQGFYMGEHGWFDKRFMYEESFRTPLIMMLPEGYDRRGDVTEMVQNIDYAPTFLEIAGVEKPADMQGVSLMPLLRGENPGDSWRPTLYYHFYEFPAEHMVKRHYGVRDDRYKLIHFYNDIDTWELYDLQADPTEMNNIYGQPGTEEITRSMMRKLKEAQEQYDDPIRFQYPINI